MCSTSHSETPFPHVASFGRVRLNATGCDLLSYETLPCGILWELLPLSSAVPAMRFNPLMIIERYNKNGVARN